MTNEKRFTPSRRQFLQGVAGAAAATVVIGRAGFPEFSAQAAGETLRALAADKGLLYGCATSKQALSTDQAYANLVGQQCGLLVPENELKWKYVEPQQGQFNFEPGDWLLNFAQSHQMAFRGHVLVWSEQLPAWFSSVTQQNAKDVMTNHITKIVSHYRGKMQSWDVVNEALGYRGNGGPLKDNPFLKLIGPDYIELAFHTAAAADPKPLLVYNETHLEYDIPDDQYRRDNLLKLLKQLVGNKVPIGALGIQSHLRTGNVPFSQQKYSDFLNRVSDMGLKIIISELDVSEKGPESSIPDRDNAVKNMVGSYLDTVLKNKSVIAVVTWGLAAKYTWISSYAPRADGQAVRPLPYDKDLQPTGALQALAAAFQQAPSR